VLVAAVVAGIACAASALAASPTGKAEELLGQRLVVALRGTTPSAGILERVRSGRVGGVILFGGNVATAPQVRRLTGLLRAAAASTGQPAPLVAVDQEGGRVRRIGWAPPVVSAVELGRLPLHRVRDAGRATGRALRALGLDVDLAPVADVPLAPGSFVAAQERAFSADPDIAGAAAVAFARGLADAGVAATAKHFPGLGRARVTTDRAAVTIRAGRSRLDADLEPFRRTVDAGVPLVMLSSAVYPALGAQPAAWSPAVHRLLRDELGFRGVTITDALEPLAATRRMSPAEAAVHAAAAGTDLLLVTGPEGSDRRVLDALLAAARSGRLTRASLERSHARILALKRTLGS
jgi:beta-N-acetylhexosaminidase